jgi:beta-lactam-binding protein with PASTA domain
VSVIDTATNTVTSTISGMNSPRGVAVRPLPPGIPVPNLVGGTQGAATSAITGAGLTLGTVTMQSSTTIAPGIIMSQNPLAGALEGSGAAVNLVVSIGVAVPNVVGETQAAASSALTAAGLALGTVTQQSSSQVAPGNVISESPLYGTDVAGGSTVSLVFSTGVAIPNVVGETQAAATSAITGAGLTVGTVTQQLGGAVAAGDVISESPAAGTNVAGNTSVNLVVSTGSGGGGGGGGHGGGGTIDWLTLGALLSSTIFALRRALGLDLRR